jgi:hypothetical protein
VRARRDDSRGPLRRRCAMIWVGCETLTTTQANRVVGAKKRETLARRPHGGDRDTTSSTQRCTTARLPMARVDPTPLRRLSARLKLVLRREHQHVHEQPNGLQQPHLHWLNEDIADVGGEREIAVAQGNMCSSLLLASVHGSSINSGRQGKVSHGIANHSARVPCRTT